MPVLRTLNALLNGLFGVRQTRAAPAAKTLPAPRAVPPVVPVTPALSPQPTTLEKMVQNAARDGRISAVEVTEISNRMIQQFSELKGANGLMAGAMAMTESGGNTVWVDPNATRFEPGFMRRYIEGKAAEAYGRLRGFSAKQLATSYGIGQVMLQSAIELYNRGYKRFGYPSPYNLQKVDAGIYFLLAAQADIVKRSGRTNESFVVMSYNGGIGANNTQTQNHLRKYLDNKETLKGLV